MKLTLSHLALATGLALAAATALAASATAPSADAVTYDQAAMQARMRQKLAYMQAVHEGMLLGDWELLQKGLIPLMELAKSATWANLRTGGYHRASGRFSEAAEDLQVAAQHHDASAATLPYLRLTMSCVECHQDVRAKLGH